MDRRRERDLQIAGGLCEDLQTIEQDKMLLVFWGFFWVGRGGWLSLTTQNDKILKKINKKKYTLCAKTG